MKKTPKTPSARETLFSYLLGGDDIAGKKIVDLFAGGGGVSCGIEMALGRSPDVAINHDPEAIAMHQHNHPLTRHYQSDVFEVDPHEATGDAEVALLWLSADCKHHSTAKGGAPLDQNLRSLAWVGCKWAGKKKPDVIVLENVPAFQSWGRLIARRAHLGPDGKKLSQVPWPNKPKRRGKACRRFKRGQPAQRPPRGPIVYQPDGRMQLHADKRSRYAGKTFRAFVKHLQGLGYVVDYRELVAADYGVPTIRKRFFLVARRDGKPICWPEQTHAAPNDPRVLSGQLQPWRTAAEIIDWTIPTISIFPGPGGRPRPLKPKTLRRIALGVEKYTLGQRAPFLVMLAHGGHDSRQRGVNQPTWTVTGAHDGTSLVQPYVVPLTADNPPMPADEPLATVTSGNRLYLAAPHLTKFREGSVGTAATAPLDTVTAGGQPARPGTGNVHGVVAAHLAHYHGEKDTPATRGQELDVPLATVPASNCHSLVSVSLMRNNDGGLDPRYASYAADVPVKTVMASGGPQSLVSAALVQYNGTADAKPLDEPLPTTCTVDRFGLMAASVLRIDNQGWCERAVVPADEPLRTVTTKNGHALMTAQVLRQYGSSDARPVTAPVGSLTAGATKDGLITTHLLPAFTPEVEGMAQRVYAFLMEYAPQALAHVPAEDRARQLVTLVVNGERFVIWDIGMRMLVPRELYRSHAFPEEYVIDFSVKGRPLANDAQVRMCGDSVPPKLVAAVIGAQFGQAMPQAAD
ncbi:DNA cytosine methyltransferase [Deinococcus sp. HMF7604]|uniref:DNA cytosine methyltransferase n=1 Tax=Deinococcus betulae TaxID=2873312 RepID=UPI001CCDD2C7|nr:DNA cytosine methyltransferase [Deinococcus betulae]MBZ9753542.1 DNA cytosine methyltransferase [Deinococcus betulae]